MNKNILIEIGTEELPSSYMLALESELNQSFKKFLKDNYFSFSDTQVWITPRRIVFSVKDIAEKQDIPEKTVKGPPLKMALRENGEESEALRGFLSKCKASGYFIEGAYVYAKVQSQNTETELFFQTEFTSFLLRYPFEKKMRWENWEFIRPIRWIVAYYGSKLIPLSLCGIESSTISRGLRGFDPIPVNSAEDFLPKMMENDILLSSQERKTKIETRLTEWKQFPDEKMVWENVSRTESPYLSEASFSKELLSLPPEVICTVISNQLKCFPAWENNQLLPKFFFVMNGNRDLAMVRKGYEKVITARLNDAKYFYERDLKTSLIDRIPDMEKMIFIDKLGTLSDKRKRLLQLAEAVSYFNLPQEDKEDLKSLIHLSKTDLATTMVQELTELQGSMGRIYANKQGIKPVIAEAIEDHYFPRSEGDPLSDSSLARNLGIIDRIDTIAGVHAIGMTISSSSDPLGLRRIANGLIRILSDKPYLFNIKDLFQKSLKTYEEVNHFVFDSGLILKNLQTFYQTRIRSLLSLYYRYDIVNAVVSDEWGEAYGLDNRCKAITNQLDSPEFRLLCDSYTRIKNITKEKDQGITELTSDMFLNQEEKELIKVLNTLSRVSLTGNHLELTEVLKSFYQLNQPITEFFDKILVMDEDLTVRKNRLQLLYAILMKLNQFADFSRIVFEGGESK